MSKRLSHLNKINALEVCPGNPESEFVNMLRQKKGIITSCQVAYNTTVSPTLCELLILNTAVYSNYKKSCTDANASAPCHSTAIDT